MYYQLSKNCTIFGKTVQKPEISISFLAYLLKGRKNILIDTLPEKVGEKFLEDLSKFISITDLDAIVLNHSESDHSGALGMILKRRPNIPICCTSACKKRLRDTYETANFMEVKDNSVLEIGEFKFRFIHTPGLHWDDNMVTYYENDKILFSNDLFGQYVAANPPVDWELSEIEVIDGAKHYYDKVFSGASRTEKQALGKLSNLDIKTIATGHGVVLNEYADKILSYYKEELLQTL